METFKKIARANLEISLSAAQPISDEKYEQLKKKAMQRHFPCSLDCPYCGGRGWYKTEDGKTALCPTLDPRKLFPGKRYGLEEEERENGWEMVVEENGIPEAVEAVKQVLERGGGWVYLWGAPGVGKSLVLKIAVAVSLRSRREAAYVCMAEIIDHLRAAYRQEAPDDEKLTRLDWWRDLPLLAIDEFDRLKLTDYAKEKQFQIMDYRYEKALSSSDPKITLMASNADPLNFDPYLSDRIRDGRFKIIRVDGQSMRPVMLPEEANS